MAKVREARMEIDLDGIMVDTPVDAAAKLARMYIIHVERGKDPRGNPLTNGDLARAESRIIDAAHAVYARHGESFKSALKTQHTDFYAKTFPNRATPHCQD